jgi:hypothetical protein
MKLIDPNNPRWKTGKNLELPTHCLDVRPLDECRRQAKFSGVADL